MGFRLAVSARTLANVKTHFQSQTEFAREPLMRTLSSLNTTSLFLIGIAINYEEPPSSIEMIFYMPTAEREFRLKLALAHIIKDDPESFGAYQEGLREIGKTNLLSYGKEESIAAKKKFICDPENLTIFQRQIVAKFCSVEEEKLSSEHIEQFGNSFKEICENNPAFVRNYWQSYASALFATSSLVSKLRFYRDLKSGVEFTDQEKLIFESVTGKKFDDATDSHKDSFVISFIEKRKAKFRDDSSAESYLPYVFRALEMSIPSDINNDALIESEYRLLLDFLGIPIPTIQSTISREFAYSKAASRRLDENLNQDSKVTVCTLVNGQKIVLDAVFDGIGGQMNGRDASITAKDTLEIAGLCGWITKKEDLYFLMTLMDLAVVARQLENKVEENDWIENDMATTATILMQKGNHAYVTYCGDSSAKIVRDGVLLVGTIPHNFMNIMNLQPTDPRLNYPKKILHTIQSCLGSVMGVIGLPRGDQIIELILEPRDIVMLYSDGMDQVCFHEIAEKCGEIPSELIKLAERRTKEKGFDKDTQLPCGCLIEAAGCDDKTIILRFAKDGA